MADFRDTLKTSVSNVANAFSGNNQDHKGEVFTAAAALATEENRYDSAKESVDPFWKHKATFAEIETTRWNKAFPYQLMILEKGDKGYKIKDNWKFTLPIPPQSLSISTPFAITTTVTLGGIIEEHNGAPLRTIQLSGTTGVLPLRGSSFQSGNKGLVSTVFAGTIQAGTQTLGALQNTISTDSKPSINLIDEKDDTTMKGTGYYQFLLLKRFLEHYASVKKTSAGRELRLAFISWKEGDDAYLVTPVQFDVSRNASSPLEYNYSLVFRAWKRIPWPPEGTAQQPFGSVKDPTVLGNILNRLDSARRTLHGFKNTLRAVRTDINSALFTPLRKVCLFARDSIGAAVSAADLPSSIATQLKESYLELQSNFSLRREPSNIIKGRTNDESLKLSVQSGKAEMQSGKNAITSKELAGASPINKIFDNPDDNFEFFANIRIGDLNLKPSITKALVEERERMRTLTRQDFEDMRDSVLGVLEDFCDSTGMGSSEYNSAYNRNTQLSDKTPTDDDYEVMFQLNASVIELDKLAASNDIDPNQVTSIDYIAGLASRSGIAFQTPRSKYSVPFPYGYTLEMLARDYLGDPNRWLEIATLNGLRAPYVDETGFELPLLTNGNGNEVTVSDILNLYVGQQVWIVSSTTTRTKRRITHIRKVSENNYSITISGDADLGSYLTVDSAKLQAYLPDTVNSQMAIFIPSEEEPAEDNFNVKAIPGVDYFDDMVRVGGIDLLLDNRGDLVITPDGDSRLSIGLTNIIQKVRLALGTPRGSLMHHPDYGLPVVPGMSTADVDAKQLLNAVRGLFNDDPSFSGVSSVVVNKIGPTCSISMGVGVGDLGKTIPVTVQLAR